MRKFLSLFLVIAVAGCGDLTGVSSNVQGTYQLYSIDGQRVPVAFDTQYGQDVFVSGTLRLNSDGSFAETTHIDEVYAGRTDRVVEQELGSYTARNGSITLDYDSGGWVDGEYDRSEIVLYAEDAYGSTVIIRYRR